MWKAGRDERPKFVAELLVANEAWFAETLVLWPKLRISYFRFIMQAL
jgi:hypothetical protein